MAISYFYPQRIPGYGVLSCDNVRISFEVHKNFALQFSSLFSSLVRTDVESQPTSNKMGTYRHLWTISYSPDASMSIGFGLNAGNQYENSCKGFLDFNPNKVGSFERFWTDYNEIKGYCGMWECKRVDIALDIPIERRNVFVRKDQRLYTYVMHSVDDKTEYLGRRSNVGFVKVYNKAIESNMDSPLTRIEVTTELDANKYISHFPQVYIPKSKQIELEEVCDLNSSDSALLFSFGRLAAANLNPFEMFNILDRRKRKKLEPFLPVEPISSPFLSYVISCFESVKDSYGL